MCKSAEEVNEKQEKCKKKILIMSHFMHPGGVERSLLGLLHGIDHSRYEVSLFLFRHEGELLLQIPKEVTLLPEIEAYAQLARPVIEVLCQGHFLLAVARVRGKLVARRYQKIHGGDCSQVELYESHRYTRRWMPPITPETEYNLAISFLTPHYFVAQKVRAKQKAAWVHTDYSAVQVEDAEEVMWDAYDRIAAVSPECEKAFVQRFPRLQKKTECVENLLPVELIYRQAADTSNNDAEILKKSPLVSISNPYKKFWIQNSSENQAEQSEDYLTEKQSGKTWTLLSIGRFCRAKNFDSIPELCRRIQEQGVRIIWYLIGYGSDETLIRQKIREQHVEKSVILLGKKANPYPYLAACDWYVQPSRYEGKSVAVREAQALHKPVIITAYPTAESQFVNGYDGVIVPLETKACSQAMAEILQDDYLRETLIANTRKQSYAGIEELQKIYHWMDMDR